jgi:hypothetical protein
VVHSFVGFVQSAGHWVVVHVAARCTDSVGHNADQCMGPGRIRRAQFLFDSLTRCVPVGTGHVLDPGSWSRNMPLDMDRGRLDVRLCIHSNRRHTLAPLLDGNADPNSWCGFVPSLN